MKIIGIVCEYNPPHLGHARQIQMIRRQEGPDTALVCLMSGLFVQRGAPALIHKQARAGAALAMGADLVLELPISSALSSAEGFASGAVRILGPFCHGLSFGAETANPELFRRTAGLLLKPAFSQALKDQLRRGLSFPAARQAALEAMGEDTTLLTQPNNILGVEYAKAIAAFGCTMELLPIQRHGDYHAATPDPLEPSATALRAQMEARQNWRPYVPASVQPWLEGAPLHTLSAGERAILGKLRAMEDGDFQALPFGSEGLWRKLMHHCRQAPDLDSILEAVKSKRYTRTRLNRMVMCAFLGLTQTDLQAGPPYCRVLALNDRGRTVLRRARETGAFYNVGQPVEHPWWAVEQRCADLYGLCRVDRPDPPGEEARQRILYRPDCRH